MAKENTGKSESTLDFVKENNPKAVIDFYEKKEKVQELRHLESRRPKPGLRFFEGC